MDATGSTCIATTIPNCFSLSRDGTCRQCIGVGRSASYYINNPTNANTITQTTPVGGGIRDYGRSNDGKTCFDNLANGNPHCQEYLTATSCNLCDTGFTLV